MNVSEQITQMGDFLADTSTDDDTRRYSSTIRLRALNTAQSLMESNIKNEHLVELGVYDKEIIPYSGDILRRGQGEISLSYFYGTTAYYRGFIELDSELYVILDQGLGSATTLYKLSSDTLTAQYEDTDNNKRFYCIATDGTNLYIGGGYDNYPAIWRWDGSTLTELFRITTVNEYISTLFYDPYSGVMYAGTTHGHIYIAQSPLTSDSTWKSAVYSGLTQTPGEITGFTSIPINNNIRVYASVSRRPTQSLKRAMIIYTTDSKTFYEASDTNSITLPDSTTVSSFTEQYTNCGFIKNFNDVLYTAVWNAGANSDAVIFYSYDGSTWSTYSTITNIKELNACEQYLGWIYFTGRPSTIIRIKGAHGSGYDVYSVLNDTSCLSLVSFSDSLYIGTGDSGNLYKSTISTHQSMNYDISALDNQEGAFLRFLSLRTDSYVYADYVDSIEIQDYEENYWLRARTTHPLCWIMGDTLHIKPNTITSAYLSYIRRAKELVSSNATGYQTTTCEFNETLHELLTILASSIILIGDKAEGKIQQGFSLLSFFDKLANKKNIEFVAEVTDELRRNQGISLSELEQQTA